jgi:hypothetical protein
MWQLLVVFALGYIIGGVSALVLISFTLASRNGTTTQHRSKITNDP